jgi:hypothetical protein
MIGKRNTGKSFLIRDLLFHNKDYPCAVAISATEIANKFYGNMLPPLFIHDEFSTGLLDNIMTRQKLILEESRTDESVDKRCILILDDVMHDNKYWKTTQIRNIFMNGRHWHIMLIFASQYALAVPPNLRANVDYVFILRENILSNRKRLFDHYAGMFPSFDFFCQVMDETTDNYKCLVIDNSSQSNKLEDQVFWYKASKHDEFHIGSKQLWDHNSQYYTDKRKSIQKQCKNKVQIELQN